MSKKKETEDTTARHRFRTVFNRTFLVEAGAGTGKTTLLVDRLLSALARGVTDAPGLVAITFTERAAAELQVRVRQALERVVTGGASALAPHEQDALEGVNLEDPIVTERLRRALHELDRAHVSTIHAFCRELLQVRPLESRLDPRESRLDDEGVRRRVAQKIEQAWMEAQDAGDPAVRDLVELGYRTETAVELAQTLFKQVDLLDHLDLSALDIPMNHRIDSIRQKCRELFEFAEANATDACRQRGKTYRAIRTLLDEAKAHIPEKGTEPSPEWAARSRWPRA
jgi:ATP-dependent exoDNAse (exonuclease V) beta subunit